MRNIFLIAATLLLLTGCTSKDKEAEAESLSNIQESAVDDKQLETDYLVSSKDYYQDVQKSIDELNLILEDEAYVEVEINSMLLIASEMVSKSTDLSMADKTYLNADLYDQYESTRNLKNELKNLINSLNDDLYDSTLDYEESMIVKTRNTLRGIEKKNEEVIKQLELDQVK